jgi:SAM-dependent methyltransferase
MKSFALDVMVCPNCAGAFEIERDEVRGDEIVEGRLTCRQCMVSYPIRGSVGRFVPQENYSSSFGIQWNLFRRDQVDKFSGTTLSRDRFLQETEWTSESVEGRLLLDVGCGAGRFTEIALSLGAKVIAVDLSSAVDACHSNFPDHPNLTVIQASLFDLPIRKASADGLYCIGVIQHTPDPEKAVRILPTYVAPGGRVALTIYPRRWSTLLFGKYLLRPLTRRMNGWLLLFMVRASMPILFPLTDLLFRLPGVGKIFAFLIPVANYVHEPQLRDWKKRYRWAVLDTYDMLAPAYDDPQKASDVGEWLEASGLRDPRSPRPGTYIGEIASQP